MTLIETVSSTATAENPAAGLSPYELRHLVPHMRAGGLDEYIHSLLGLDSVTTDDDGASRRRNAWFQLKMAADDQAAFLSDVHTAWDLADLEARSTEYEVRGRGIARGIRYALVHASLASKAANIPAGLLITLVRRGLWSGQRAMATVLQLGDHEELAAALEVLAATFVAAGRADDVLVTSERLEGDQRVRVLAALAGVAGHSAELVNRVIGEAESIEDERQRVAVLLAASVSPYSVDRVIRASTTFAAEGSRVEVLAACVPMASREQRVAIEAAAATLSAGGKTRLYAALAPVLDMQEAEVALLALGRLRMSIGRVAIGRRLADRLSEPGRSSWLASQRALLSKLPVDDRPRFLSALGDGEEAVRLAKRIRGKHKRILTLAHLAAHLSTGDLEGVLDALLARAGQFTPHERGRVVVALAPYLPKRLAPKALRVTREILHSYPRTDALVALAPSLPERSVPSALRIAVELKDLELRGRALRALAPRLNFKALDDLVITVRNARMSGIRPRLLANIVDHLAEDHIRAVFAWTVRIGDPSDRRAVIGVLAPRLPDDLLDEALARLEHVGDYGISLQARARLAAQGLTGSVASVLKEVLAQRPSDQGIAVLASLAPAMTKEDYALARRWLGWRTGTYGSIESFAALAPGLLGVGGEELLLETLLARPLALSAQQLSSMATVADQLSPPMRARFISARGEQLARAHRELVEMESSLRAYREAYGAPFPLGPQEALWVDFMWPDPFSGSARKHDLAIGIAAVGNADDALAIARSIDSIHWRVETLNGLASFVEGHDRTALIREVLEYLRTPVTWQMGEFRYVPDYSLVGLQSVGNLSPHLDARTSEAFLEALTAIADVMANAGDIGLRSVTDAEAGIAQRMSRRVRQQVLDRGFARLDRMSDARLQELTLGALARCIDVDWVDAWLTRVQERLPPQRRADAYRELAARLADIGEMARALDVAIGIETPEERQAALVHVAAAMSSAADSGPLWVADGSRLGLVRRLGTRSRPVLLADIAAMAPTIAAAGGGAAIAEAYDAVEDVVTWWP